MPFGLPLSNCVSIAYGASNSPIPFPFACIWNSIPLHDASEAHAGQPVSVLATADRRAVRRAGSRTSTMDVEAARLEAQCRKVPVQHSAPDVGRAILPAAAFPGGSVGPYALLRSLQAPAESRLQPRLAAPQILQNSQIRENFAALRRGACSTYTGATMVPRPRMPTGSKRRFTARIASRCSGAYCRASR